MPTTPPSATRAGVVFRLGVIVCLLISALVVAAGRSQPARVDASAGDASVFTPMTPQRLVDTRIGLGTPMGRLQAGKSVDIQVTDRLGIPSNATAVVANVIAVDADRPGYLQLLPTGQAAFRSSSTLNTDTPGQTIPNAAFVPLGDNGKLTVFAVFTTDVVIDVSGYFTPATTSKAGRLVPLTPTRILDTRISLGWTPQLRLGERVTAETIITLQVAGRGVPTSGVSAVVMNVTAVDPAGPGYVQVAPTPVVPRATSNLNTAAGRTIANLVVVPLGVAGTVDLFTTINADLVADVVGYFTDSTAPESSAGLFVPITPNRQLDTRLPAPHNPPPEGTVTTIDISDISATAIAIAGNLTATEATEPGYLQLAAPPIAIRTSSNLNISYAGQTIANAVVSPVAGGRVQLYNRFPTHELLDVTGWFTSVASSLPPTPTTAPPPTTTSPPATTTTMATPTTTTTTSTTTTTTTTLDTTPPTLNLPPYAEFVIGSSIGPSPAPTVPGEIDGTFTEGITEVAKWDANDPSGICGYDVWAEYAGHEPFPVLIGTDATQAEAMTRDYDDEFGGGSEKFIGYEVTAYDCAGNTTTEFINMVPHVIQENGFSPNGYAEFTYEGDWETGNYSGFSGGHTRKTSAEGASVTIDVNGQNDGQHVALVMEKAPNRGEAEVYVDGEYETTINTYSDTTVHRVIVFDVGLSAGPHTIEVVNKATPGHPRIDLDAVLTNGYFT